jgi:hypothetical protein
MTARTAAMCCFVTCQPLFCLNSLIYAAVGDSVREEEFNSMVAFVTGRNIHSELLRLEHQCGLWGQ